MLLWYVCDGIWRPVDTAHTEEAPRVCSCVWKSVCVSASVCNAGQCSVDGRLVKSVPKGGQTKADLSLMRSSAVYRCLCLFVWWLNAPSCSRRALGKYWLSFRVCNLSYVESTSLCSPGTLVSSIPSWYFCGFALVNPIETDAAQLRWDELPGKSEEKLKHMRIFSDSKRLGMMCVESEPVIFVVKSKCVLNQMIY